MNRNQNELQSLFNNDKTAWQKEANAKLVQAKKDRVEQISTRAFGLKAKREAERLEFVKKCYERQRREQCDELRAMRSKETLNQILMDRKVDSQRKTHNDDSVECNTTNVMCLLQKEELDERLKNKNIAETRRALDKQIELKRILEAATAARIQHEEQEQLRLLAKLDREARESEKRASEKAKQDREEMFKDTLQRTKEKQERRNLEKKRDVLLLQHALHLENDVKKAEHAKLIDGKAAYQEFIQCLKEQTQYEEEENENLRRIRDEELDRIAKKHEERLAAEAKERQSQLEQITKTREQQIMLKSREAEMKRRKDQDEIKEAKADLRRAEEADRRDQEKARNARLEVSFTSWSSMLFTTILFHVVLHLLFKFCRRLLPTKIWQTSSTNKSGCIKKRFSRKRGLEHTRRESCNRFALCQRLKS